MGSYGLSQAAEHDLDGIYTFSTCTFGVTQADRYLAQLHTCAQMAADFPLLGREYRTKDGDVFRRYDCGRHSLFYRIEASGDIYIERVIHDARDFDRHL